MLKHIKNTHMYIGPMTKNVVDGVIDYVNRSGESIGFIASRRQIDFTGGYVNDWDTFKFVKYVKSKNQDILVCRDHGGIHQGSKEDDGVTSFLADVGAGMDIIHIDPWKENDIEYSINYTIDAINTCIKYSSSCLFEVGSEQAIHVLTPDSLDYFLWSIKTQLKSNFSRIIYAVIQSGTLLKSGTNIGVYDETKLLNMLSVCDKYNLLSKEHNGDYLDPKQIKHKFNLGLSSINIAPEIANIETKYILDNISEQGEEEWFVLCLRDGQWKKWFSEDVVVNDNKNKILRLCGHYVFSSKGFQEIFNLSSISKYVISDVCDFLSKRRLVDGCKT